MSSVFSIYRTWRPEAERGLISSQWATWLQREVGFKWGKRSIVNVFSMKSQENQDRDRIFNREVSIFDCQGVFVLEENMPLKPKPWTSPLIIYLFVFALIYVSINLSTWLEWYSAVTRAVTQFVRDIERKAVSYFFLLHPSIRTGCIVCSTAVSLSLFSSLSFFCSGTRSSPVCISKGQNRNTVLTFHFFVLV